MQSPLTGKPAALAMALGVTRRYILEWARIIEPADTADLYFVELAGVLGETTDERRDDSLIDARWKA